ncbi:MAG: DUF4232 domain-containing protein [Acidimicrobiales bacterium]
MPLMETPDDLDERLRELFHSFDSSLVLAASSSSDRRIRLSRGRAVAWAAAIAVALVIALVSVQLAQSHSVRTPTGPPPTKASTTGACAKSQLKADVVFNQPGTELGAIQLTDTSKRACSLSGRPQIVVYDSTGHSLGLSESVYRQAPDLPAPKSPIDLSASGSAPQAIVDLDWCGFQTLHGEIGIRFSGWTGELVVQDSSIMPPGFSPPSCLDPSQRLLAVDYVRAWPSIGGIAPSVTVAPADDLRSGEAVQVSVKGFAPYASFNVSECASEADFDLNPPGCGTPRQFESTNGYGDDSITFDVQTLASTQEGSAPSVTCTDQCVIVASPGSGSTAKSAYAPIRFGPVVQQTTSCTFSQLRITATFGGVGLGHVSVLLLFKNSSSTTCSLYGYPGVAGLNAQGVQITQAVRTLNGYMGGAGQSAPLVTLIPGQLASAIVEGTDNPTGTATTCTTYPKLLVTPPNTTQSVTIDMSMPGCSGLQVHPVVPRT